MSSNPDRTDYAFHEWAGIGIRRMADDFRHWVFQCPRCGRAYSVLQFLAAGGDPGGMARTCISRYTDGECRYTIGAVHGNLAVSLVHFQHYHPEQGGTVLELFGFGPPEAVPAIQAESARLEGKVPDRVIAATAGALGFDRGTIVQEPVEDKTLAGLRAEPEPRADAGERMLWRGKLPQDVPEITSYSLMGAPVEAAVVGSPAAPGGCLIWAKMDGFMGTGTGRRWWPNAGERWLVMHLLRELTTAQARVDALRGWDVPESGWQSEIDDDGRLVWTNSMGHVDDGRWVDDLRVVVTWAPRSPKATWVVERAVPRTEDFEDFEEAWIAVPQLEGQHKHVLDACRVGMDAALEWWKAHGHG